MPDTWEDVHRIGKLKAAGHPVGIQLSHSEDSNHILRGIMWSFGGKEVKDGKTVAINSKETIEAYKFVKALYADTMEDEVLAWDDRNNNVCLNSGKCGIILNPISAYISARKDNALIPNTQRPIHLVINHVLPPKGQRPSYVSGTDQCGHLGVFSPEGPGQGVPTFKTENYNRTWWRVRAIIRHSSGILPSTRCMPRTSSTISTYIASYSHAPGWPGSPTAAAEVVWISLLFQTPWQPVP